MSKAAFGLWRDNLDLHLEEFGDFGLGTNKFLKKVRLHPIVLRLENLKDFYGDLKSEGAKVGNMRELSRMDIHRANRELYKFLHKKIMTKTRTCFASG